MNSGLPLALGAVAALAVAGALRAQGAANRSATVAALYVDLRRGPYAALPGVAAYGAEEDATTYAGPDPVVAHPPCGHWGNYSARAHDDGRTGPVAVDQVRTWGGVLEHPRRSKLWRAMGMPKPGEPPDAWGGYTIEVSQHWWGHPAEKRTWLYIVGVPPNRIPPLPEQVPPPPSRVEGRVSRGVIERMAKSKRHLTPPSFAAWLVELARRVENR